MTEIITALLPYIPSNAISLVVVVIVYLYIQSKRKETKIERDADSQEIHDKLLKLEFDVTNIKGNVGHHQDVLDDLRNQINVLNGNIIKLTVSLDNLVNNLEKR